MLGAFALPLLRLTPGKGRLLKGLLAEPNNLSNSPDLSLEQIAQLYQYFIKGSRLSPIYTSCLHRSILFCQLIRWFRVPAVVRIGTRKKDSLFEAHAWVQYLDAHYGDVIDGNGAFSVLQSPEKKRSSNEL